MKTKTTKKQIKSNFNTILSIGYCESQYLLYYKSPFAYSSDSGGWACDYYITDNVCISTGYRPIGDKVPYKLLSKLEYKACNIVNNYVDFNNIKMEIRDKLSKYFYVETGSKPMIIAVIQEV